MDPHVEDFLENYPNLFNDDYVVDCTWEEKEDAKKEARGSSTVPHRMQTKD